MKTYRCGKDLQHPLVDFASIVVLSLVEVVVDEGTPGVGITFGIIFDTILELTDLVVG